MGRAARGGGGPVALRVLVCGGRDYTDAARLDRVLSALMPIDVVIHGAARGADTLAGQWAAICDISTEEFPADWKKHGKAAGPIRNQQMLDEGRPTFVVAFPGGRGTADMVRRAKAAGLPGLLVLQAGDVEPWGEQPITWRMLSPPARRP